MNTKRTVLIIGLVVVSVGVLVAVLASGGSDRVPVAGDAAGDIRLGSEGQPPPDPALADILDAQVTDDEGTLRFEVGLAREIPSKIKDGELEVRWDLYEGGAATWQVSATVASQPSASIVAYESDFGAGTIDHTLPGGIFIEDDRLVIRVRPGEVPDFPSRFDWEVTTSLDGDRGDPTSGRATDRTPDNGYGTYPEERPTDS